MPLAKGDQAVQNSKVSFPLCRESAYVRARCNEYSRESYYCTTGSHKSLEETAVGYASVVFCWVRGVECLRVAGPKCQVQPGLHQGSSDEGFGFAQIRHV